MSRPQVISSVQYLLRFAVVFGSLLLVPGVQAQAAGVSRADVERAANAGDFDAAYKALRQLAESGDAQAQGFLAHVLFTGEWGRSQDLSAAREWLEQAYAQNDAFARLLVAGKSRDDGSRLIGLGEPQFQSKDWRDDIRIAAEGGHPFAQHELGNWAWWKAVDENQLESGFSEAIDWYHKAALQGQKYSRVSELYIYQISPLRLADKTLEEYRKNWTELEGLVSVGNPLVYRMLPDHVFTKIDRKKPETREKYMQEAALYVEMGKIFEYPPTSSMAGIIEYTGFKDLLEEGHQKARAMLMDWANDPRTDIGQASKWCVETNKMTLHCVSHSVFRHRRCALPYMMWKFQDVTELPAYEECRAEYDRLFPPGGNERRAARVMSMQTK